MTISQRNEQLVGLIDEFPTAFDQTETCSMPEEAEEPQVIDAKFVEDAEPQAQNEPTPVQVDSETGEPFAWKSPEDGNENNFAREPGQCKGGKCEY